MVGGPIVVRRRVVSVPRTALLPRKPAPADRAMRRRLACRIRLQNIACRSGENNYVQKTRPTHENKGTEDIYYVGGVVGDFF